MNPEQLLRDRLAENLPSCEVDVSGDGSHFELVLTGDCFEGLSRLKRQQLVYKALGNLISSGAVHAVQIRARTPAEVAASD